MSIGELILKEGEDKPKRRILMWTGLIGASLFVSTMLGWFLLRGLSEGIQGLLFATGVECAPVAGRDQAALLTGVRALRFSNWTGLR
jgi:hypothetical protein